MPISVRRLVEGIKTKKINKAFAEAEKQMGCRYAVGYFICLLSFCISSGMVIFFSYLYPSDYVMSWFITIGLMYFLDFSLFTFGFAGLQLFNSLLS